MPAGRWGCRATVTQTVFYRFVAAITNQDLIAIVGFCAIGLLLTGCFIYSFANYGDMIDTL